ncbi:MAG: hypothetical protein WCH21_10110 [Bacteroidota bacterium]
MKIIITFLLVVLFTNITFAQFARVDANIKKLNNNQFTIIHGDQPMFEMNSSAAMKLIKIGKKATVKLIVALEDSTKVIMAHIVLCHIYFNVATFSGPKEFIANDRQVSKYFLGQEKGEGLILSETKINGVYKIYIEEENLKKIIAFWKNKTSQK